MLPAEEHPLILPAKVSIAACERRPLGTVTRRVSATLGIPWHDDSGTTAKIDYYTQEDRTSHIQYDPFRRVS